MNIKNIFLFTFLFSIFFPISAIGSKIIEKSGKTPKWVNGIAKDYIIVTGSGENMETAQSQALLKVKERIVSSIAENVSTSSDFYRKENSVNGISNIIENFETSTKTKSVDLLALKGVSLSNVEEYYWEKVMENNKTKIYYHLKYPFSEMQLSKLVLDFEMADKLLTEALNDILDSIESVSTTEKADEYILSLVNLSKSFLDQRKERANQGIIQLRSILQSVSIVSKQNNLGEIRYSLLRGDKPFTSLAKPKITSNCAKITETIVTDNDVTIRYNYAGCYNDPSNSIAVLYNFSGVVLKNSFGFDINAKKAEIIVSNQIVFSGGITNGKNVSGVRCNVLLFSKYDSKVTIDKVTFHWEGHVPVIIENINQSFEGKGNHDIQFTIDTPLDKSKCNSKNTVNGFIQYKSTTGEISTFKIYNQEVKTDW